MARCSIVIPAWDEEASIGRVISALPRRWVKEVVVVDGGSRDRTITRARRAGARVIRQKHPGYGNACQEGFAALREPKLVVILDGDLSDDPAGLPRLAGPIARGEADLVLGARVPALREPGALPWHARIGNTLACFLMRWTGGGDYQDCGPFRAMSIQSWRSLDLQDPGFGWNIEMQVKAARLGLRVREIPVPYRRRPGRSKISGTLSGSFRAGFKILYSVFRYRIARL